MSADLSTRTLNGYTTEYTYLQGADTSKTTTLVSLLKNGNDTLTYTYDELGNITSISENGTVIESYTYDEWGKLLSITGDESIGRNNPLRYRGYYFDEETGFYYCTSLYYDPEIGRWINADS